MSAPASDLLPRSFSMYGAPRKIQRKHGVNVTQVASRPPSVAASSGDSPPASRKAAMKPTNCSTMMSGPGRGLRHAEAVEHLARLQPVIVLHRLLRDIGEHRVGAAERDHRHLAEEDRDLAEDVRGAERRASSAPTGTSQRASQTAATRSARASVGRTWSGTASPSRLSTGRVALAGRARSRRTPACRLLRRRSRRCRRRR